ncbi:AMP-binding enzyme [Flexibacterium corallicola]|uniref:AMP-binding enzyme n=1 Tax=Flexibacterium corallicola TaxID=3037259 RepID=UPI00286F15B1|nr:hypothetical protein [Pseudovibrio sp. M1P-2-3]
MFIDGNAPCGVVGHKTETNNENVIAYVSLKSGSSCSEDDLKEFLKDKLVSYKRPARIIIVESMPMASNSKILKHRLNDMFYRD